jgi:lysophospholipase L1-like esterase
MRDRKTRTFALSTGKKLAFAVVTVIAFFLFLEVGLRLIGWGSPPVVGSLRFGYDTGIPVFDSDGIEAEGQLFSDYPLFEADPLLFWKPIANTDFTGADGLRLPLPAQLDKPGGVYRIAVIGDSCSFLGRELYTEKLARLVENEWSHRVEIINASCPGYTSFQGLRRLQDVWKWQPDLLLVYFGWNDHWNALNGCADSQLTSQQPIEWLYPQIRRLHIYWLLTRLCQPDQTPRRIGNVRTPRVPLNEYRENLCKIITEADQRGCQTVLLTAPTAFEQQRLPAWAYSFFAQFYEMTTGEISDIPRNHEQYNEIVRQVAAQRSTVIVDVAAEWKPEASSSRFRSDCIHLTEQGHAEVARAVFNRCKQMRRWQRNR